MEEGEREAWNTTSANGCTARRSTTGERKRTSWLRKPSKYLRPENRERQFERFRCGTTPEGIHVFFAFVDHPEIPTPPNWTASEYFYDPGELEQYYAEWEVLDTREIVFEDDSGGEPHEHAAEVLVARKPKPTETEERTTTDEQRRRRSE